MQVRIPADMFHAYGFGSEAMCVATDTGIEFRPIKEAADIHADLLAELLEKGLSGEELIDEFRARAAEGDGIEYAAITLPKAE